VGQDSGHSRRAAYVWVCLATTVGLFLSGYLAASSQSAPAKQVSAPASHAAPRPDILFVQTPVYVPGPLAQRFPKGSAIALLSFSRQHSVALLTNDFFAAADPQVNFDATKLLFSGQKDRASHWQIWEMDLNGANKRQVTQCSADCLRAAYLPADEIAFTVEDSSQKQFLSSLAVVKIDGSGFHPITFGTASFQLETVLRDGRIVASAPWPLRSADETGAARLFYTLRPDGTAIESYRCEHRAKTIQADAEELADGSLLFVRKAISGSLAGGELARISQGASGATPLGPSQALYQSPRQLSTNELIVAKQRLVATNSARRFDLYLMNLKTGALGERLYADEKLSSIQPIPVAPHEIPKHYWNTLNPESSTGNLISLNSYLSADEARGRISTPISRVRVFTVNPSDGQERNLGEAPVESDGSFFIKVPANAPVRFVLLDVRNQIIREEHGWVWARPGEQRGCTGCHGDKAVAPDNHWPLTLRRFDTPTPMGESEHASATSQAK
jgi:hypothetical protein